MRGLLEEYQILAASGPVGRAVVTQVWGSAPRPEGACLIATLDGRMAGSVSGGCVESAAAEEIRAVMTDGMAKKISWGVTHERAWEMGLSCGGTIEVFVEPAVRPELIQAARSMGSTVVATVIGGAAPLATGVCAEEGGGSHVLGALPEALAPPIRAAATAALTRLTSRVETIETASGP
ncbi:MAG TPA: XdhC family protein, partial [Gemmatimonadales bacterium]|nr:XdhC family protein [Gemmatimonadales bacterium]